MPNHQNKSLIKDVTLYILTVFTRNINDICSVLIPNKYRTCTEHVSNMYRRNPGEIPKESQWVEGIRIENS